MVALALRLGEASLVAARDLEWGVGIGWAGGRLPCGGFLAGVRDAPAALLAIDRAGSALMTSVGRATPKAPAGEINGDGAEPSELAVGEKRLLEVAVAGDRYPNVRFLPLLTMVPLCATSVAKSNLLCSNGVGGGVTSRSTGDAVREGSGRVEGVK